MSEAKTTATEPAAVEAQESAERTFTQAELDRIVGERIAGVKSKYADYDDLKARAAKADELEDAQKSEAEKAIARAEAAEKRLAEAEAAQKAALHEAMKTRIGAEKGLSTELIKRLQGDDEDALKADADALLAAIPKTDPVLDIGQGKKDTEAPPEDPFLAGMKQGMGRLIERK